METTKKSVTQKSKKESRRGVADQLSDYWAMYGGFHDLVRSRYLWSAVAISAISMKTWTSPNWWDIVIQIVPNLLGFTLGGYAVSLAIGNDKFRALIVNINKECGEKYSVLQRTSATFVHFVLIQLMALLIALVARSLFFKAGSVSSSFELLLHIEIVKQILSVFTLFSWGIGYLLFIYSLCLSIAACMAIFDLSLQLNEYQSTENEINDHDR